MKAFHKQVMLNKARILFGILLVVLWAGWFSVVAWARGLLPRPGMNLDICIGKEASKILCKTWAWM